MISGPKSPPKPPKNQSGTPGGYERLYTVGEEGYRLVEVFPSKCRCGKVGTEVEFTGVYCKECHDRRYGSTEKTVPDTPVMVPPPFGKNDRTSIHCVVCNKQVYFSADGLCYECRELKALVDKMLGKYSGVCRLCDHHATLHFITAGCSQC